MTNDVDRVEPNHRDKTYSRRDVLKGTLAVGAGALAISALGSRFLAQTAEAADGMNLHAGAVYAMTNQITDNAVVAFYRAPDGSLTLAGTFATGGRGSGGFDQSQNALVLSGRPGADRALNSNQLLFVVNPGSNDVSVLAVEDNGLTLVSRAPSGGSRPTSVTVHDDLLYVLNAGALPGGMGGVANIAGFTLGPRGELTPLPGSTRPLSGNPAAGAAQVQFDPKGGLLLVTERNANVIDTYRVDQKTGLAGPPMPNANAGVAPFGFAFTDRGAAGQVIVAQGFQAGPGQGGATSYIVTDEGALQTVSPDVRDGQDDTCWVVITNDKQYAYVSNFFSDTVSSYQVGSDASLTLLNPVAGQVDPGGRANDEALSIDSRFLYVRNFTTGNISAFQVNTDGSLSPLPGANALSPAMGYGLAAR